MDEARDVAVTWLGRWACDDDEHKNEGKKINTQKII